MSTNKSRAITESEGGSGVAEFPRHLRHWRTLRGLSQEKLAEAAGLSLRHLNFMENGRAKPSNEVVLSLGRALGLSLKNTNALLRSAGFANHYKQTELSAKEMTQVKTALDSILAQQQPYPGIVMSPIGEFIQCNNATIQIFSRFVPLETLLRCTNVYELFFSNEGFKPFVKNWHELAPHILSFVKQEVFELDAGNNAYRLFKKLIEHSGIDEDWQKQVAMHDNTPIFQIQLHKNELKLAFFSTYTTFGTPFDISLQELRIECFYPADQTTEEFCRSLNATNT